MTKKVLSIIVVVLAVVIVFGCIGAGILGYIFLPVYYASPAPCEIVIPPEEIAPSAVCDPSTIPFTDMGELNPNVETTINGPAIYEWWTGGTNEGVQRVDAGDSITIHGTAGHWWTLPSQQGLDCAWNLHVSNYAAKPQHEGKTLDQLVVPPPADLLK